MIFVVGAGRCGTASVTRLFQDAGCEAVHENPHAAPIVQLAVHYTAGVVTHTHAVDLIRQMELAEVEVWFKYSELIPVLRDAFPGCRIVWLYRRAVPSVWSMIRNGWYRPSDDLFWPVQQVRWISEGGKLRLHVDLNYEGHRTTPADIGYREWERWPQPMRCAWWWLWINSRIGKQAPDYVTSIEHLDAVDLLAWAEAPNIEAVLPQLGRTPQAEMPDRLAELVDRMCGEMETAMYDVG